MSFRDCFCQPLREATRAFTPSLRASFCMTKDESTESLPAGDMASSSLSDALPAPRPAPHPQLLPLAAPTANGASSPGSGISPKSQPPQKGTASPDGSEQPADYFTLKATTDGAPTGKVAFELPSKQATQETTESVNSVSETTASTTTATSTVVSPSITASSGEPGGAISGNTSSAGGSRKSSVASVTFRVPNMSLPQGTQRQKHLLQEPTHKRFRKHVAFDNVIVGEATKSNTPSYTVTVRHDGYHPKRRSRTFMVGIDDHPYSNGALRWLLEEFIDDGDEIICVRVVDKDIRLVGEKNYQEEANELMAKIQAKSGNDRAISIVLEYAVGKLHSTFQRLIQMYQPSMLIVGTRGRSLGGLQGLMNTRNSFSKYCLQYSPIPVVVVRPDDKRQKKKDKRSQDPEKQAYAKMLASNNGVHEADSESTSLFEVEAKLSPEQEAHKVATALGLPAAFDPTLKPIKNDSIGYRSSSLSAVTDTAPPSAEDGRVVETPGVAAANDSDEGESGDEEDDFEVACGSQILQSQKKERLHEMEVGEAAVLRNKPADLDEDEDEDDDEDGGGEVGKVPSAE